MYQFIRRSLLCVGAAAGFAIALGAGCGSGVADPDGLVGVSADELSADGGVPKITICHYPPGNRANMHSITIGYPAVAAHVRNHGDTIGPCGGSSSSGGADADAGNTTIPPPDPTLPQ
jgi:hypothetical protein